MVRRVSVLDPRREDDRTPADSSPPDNVTRVQAIPQGESDRTLREENSRRTAAPAPMREYQVPPADSARESQVVADHRARPGLPADRAILTTDRAQALGAPYNAAAKPAGPAPTMTRSWTCGECRVFTPSACAMSTVGLVDHGTVVEDSPPAIAPRRRDVRQSAPSALGLRRIEAIGNRVASHRLSRSSWLRGDP